MTAMEKVETSVGKVGPNAVLQLRSVLIERLGHGVAHALFEAAGHLSAYDWPPTEMVDQRLPADLFATLFERLTPAQAEAIAQEAGIRTADYILENRLPIKVRRLLEVLPPVLAVPMLLNAIKRHAWTFVGTGTFSADAHRRPQIEIADNPMPMPGAVWHCAVFERLFRRLVCAGTTVRHMPGRNGTDRFVLDYGHPCRAGKGNAFCMDCVVR